MDAIVHGEIRENALHKILVMGIYYINETVESKCLRQGIKVMAIASAMLCEKKMPVYGEISGESIKIWAESIDGDRPTCVTVDVRGNVLVEKGSSDTERGDIEKIEIKIVANGAVIKYMEQFVRKHTLKYQSNTKVVMQ